MTPADAVLASEDRFFQALLRGDGAALQAVLAPDFLLIDVMTGSEIPGTVLQDLVGSGQLRFESVERVDARVRLYGSAAVPPLIASAPRETRAPPPPGPA